MPIDPSLITDTMARWQVPAPIPGLDPLAAYAKLQALKSGVVQQQIQQQALQSGALDLQEKQQAFADQKAMNDIYKSAYEVDPTTGQPKLNEDKLYSAMAAGGQGAKIPQTQKAIMDSKKSAADLTKAQADAQEAAQNYLGEQVLDIADSGYNPTTFKAKVAMAVDHGALPAPAAAKMLQQFDQNPTSDTVKALIDPLLTAPKVQDIREKRATAAKNQAEADKAKADVTRADETARLARVDKAMQAVGAAKSQAQLDQAYQDVANAGAKPEELMKLPRMWSQAAMDQWDQSQQSAEQRIQSKQAADTLAQTKTRDENTARHERVQESIEATRNQLQQTAARGDRSYQSATHELDQIGKPVSDTVQRLTRLQDTLAQNSPQADALVAPELLSVMAGGSGSGLRMNEAEISRIVGGRSKWQDLQAAINKWQLDPSKATSITPEQRKQIRDLTSAVSDRIYAKQNALNEAYKTVAGSQDPNEHRQAVLAARQAIANIDTPGGAGGAAASAPKNPFRD